MRNLKLILLGFFCFVYSGSYSQDKASLKGRVLEKGTEIPVQNMAIFIPYTTIGTTTADDGRFELMKIPEGIHEIHFRHLAYDLYVMDYDALVFGKGNSDTREIEIQVNPLIIEIEEVSLTGDPSKRKAYLKIFNEYCLGDITGLSCFLQNPDDIYFFMSNNSLNARASKPLLIYNKKFGFKITLYLDDFQFLNPFAEDVDLIDQFYPFAEDKDLIDQFYSFSGSPLFEVLEASNFFQDLNWEKNREAAFEGSQRHFFMSVYRNRLSKNGYSLRAINHSIDEAYRSVGMTRSGSLDQSLNIDSIMDWNSSDKQPKNYYYFPLLDYPDLTSTERQNVKCKFMVGDSILIFHDQYQSSSLKDDQAILLYTTSGQIDVNEKGHIIQDEGDLLWKFLGNQRNLRSVLPLEYMPRKFAEKTNRRTR